MVFGGIYSLRRKRKKEYRHQDRKQMNMSFISLMTFEDRTARDGRTWRPRRDRAKGSGELRYLRK